MFSDKSLRHQCIIWPCYFFPDRLLGCSAGLVGVKDICRLREFPLEEKLSCKDSLERRAAFLLSRIASAGLLDWCKHNSWVAKSLQLEKTPKSTHWVLPSCVAPALGLLKTLEGSKLPRCARSSPGASHQPEADSLRIREPWARILCHLCSTHPRRDRRDVHTCAHQYARSRH